MMTMLHRNAKEKTRDDSSPGRPPMMTYTAQDYDEKIMTTLLHVCSHLAWLFNSVISTRLFHDYLTKAKARALAGRGGSRL